MTEALIFYAVALFWAGWLGCMVAFRPRKLRPPLPEREARAVEETKQVRAIARAIQPASNVVHVEFRRVAK
jgi:hypothetical protein